MADIRLSFLLLLAAPAYAQEICRQCHPAIAASYAKTPMARTSGAVGTIALPSASFTDPSTGATFTITNGEGKVSLTAERGTPSLKTSRDLRYFIGSGRVGRSFLFEAGDGYLFQSPVSLYSEGNTWRASPGFGRATAVNLTRAVEPSCLLCHASRIQHVAGPDNRYDPGRPFPDNGISCERCHGDGSRHVAAMRSPAARRGTERWIVNPAKLPPQQRDSVCAQCHLTGASRVARAETTGRGSYRPGDDLARSVAVFVRADAKDARLNVTSHFEKLAWSRCKELSGDRLWCGTCHDPHGKPVDVRERCLTCHATKSCSLDLAARQAVRDDCQTCHMPKSPAQDVEHAVYTDHSIPRRPVDSAGTDARGDLVPFAKHQPADSRDLALAYSVIAMTEPAVRRRAFELLQSSAARNPDDIAVIAQLAQFYDRLGQPERALPLLERVVAGSNPNSAAMINLGTLYAQSGRLQEAISVWERALLRNPALTQARLNLAVAQLRDGKREAGLASLRTALAWDPDNQRILQMIRQAE